MSLDVSGLSVYTDENKMDLIKKSILEGRTMDFVVIQPDIKTSANINIFDSNLVAQAGSCGFNADGTTTLSTRNLAVSPIKINEAICVETLESYYTQTMMKKGSYQEELPFEKIYAEQKAEKIGDMLESIVWKGDKASGTGNMALADGLLKVIDGESGSVVEGNVSSATSITASNVIELVDDMVANVPADIIDADDLVLFVGYEVYRLYAKALMQANLFHYRGEEGADFQQNVPGTNVKIVAVKGLNGSDRMILTRKANLYVGVDLLNDAEDFKIFYSQDNDEVRFISKFKIGVQVAFPSLIVEFSI